MGDVVRIKGLTTAVPLEPDLILASAKDNLSDVLVLGWEKDDAGHGEFYMASSDADLSRALMLILRAQKHIMERMI